MSEYTSEQEVHDHDRDYALLRAGVANSFAHALAIGGGVLFRTSADTGYLWQIYLEELPEAERQVHTCYACRRFMQQFGGLVAIAEDNTLVPAFWDVDHVPKFYAPMIAELAGQVRAAIVMGLFLTEEKDIGRPVTGIWEHLAVSSDGVWDKDPPKRNGALLTNINSIRHFLGEVRLETLVQAEKIIEIEALPRSERFLEPVGWLRRLKTDFEHTKHHQHRAHLLWRRVALAPEGFCHPRTSVLATLFADLEDGSMTFEQIRQAFARKVDPTRYQRPTAAPTAGQIEQAERIVAELNLKPSLGRRYATVEDIPQWLWKASEAEKEPMDVDGKAFNLVRPRGQSQFPNMAKPLDIPAVVMTWERFAAVVMPDAIEIELMVRAHTRAWLALTTAVDPEAMPILKWDRPRARNPFAWFVKALGWDPELWGLAPGARKLVGIVELPTLWGPRPLKELGAGVVLIPEGVQCKTPPANLCLFPEHLISDLHGVRQTIEAYSQQNELAGAEAANAVGLDVRSAIPYGVYPFDLRVLNPTGWTMYRVDRWH